MLAQGPALFMMCYMNSGEFERLLNVHSQRDEQRLLFKDGLLKASKLDLGGYGSRPNFHFSRNLFFAVATKTSASLPLIPSTWAASTAALNAAASLG